ncbi:substrate-binding periplasmic protein [Deinococcus oregonensis]|uniref:Substrate-binding periplasmic protein n=1 Tax=Deinococcus oregonensis TaxID=1805970 RepID=A0ABV6B2B3_9DEIO
MRCLNSLNFRLKGEPVMMRRFPGTLTLISPLLLGAAALMPAQAQSVSAGKLKLAFSTSTPGLIYEEGSGVQGFAAELITLMARDLKIKTMTWTRVADPAALYTDLAKRTQNVIFDVKLPQALDEVNASAAVACTGGVILSRPKGPTTEAALKGLRIAVAQNTVYFHYARNLPFDKKVEVFSTPDQALLGFLSGSVDVLILDRFDALKMFKKAGPSKLQVSPLLWNESVHFVMHKSEDDFRDNMNATLKKFLSDGTYAKLSKKYFTQDVRCLK